MSVCVARCELEAELPVLQTAVQRPRLSSAMINLLFRSTLPDQANVSSKLAVKKKPISIIYLFSLSLPPHATVKASSARTPLAYQRFIHGYNMNMNA